MSGTQTDTPKSPKSPRPQSIMAQNFSLALDDIFGLGSTAKLEEHVDQKEQTVSQQQAELDALKARLQATEQRLNATKLGKKADEDDATTGGASSQAPKLPGMGLRTSPGAAGKPVRPQNDSDDEEGEGTEEISGGNDDDEEEDEDSSEETSSDEEPQPRRR